MKKNIFKFVAIAMIIATCALVSCQAENEVAGSETNSSEIAEIAREVVELIRQTEYYRRIIVFPDGGIRSMVFPIGNKTLSETRNASACLPGWTYGGSFLCCILLDQAISSILAVNRRNGYGTDLSVRPYHGFEVLCHRRITGGPRADCPPGELPKCPFPDKEFTTFFPHPNDCHWFFHCSMGVAFCSECPAGLHWNAKLETCDFPFRAGCQE